MNDLMKTPKMTPRIQSTLKHTVEVPEVMYKASGINVNGRRIKSLLFSTDVALIANNNADAILSVYPFTPTIQITNTIIDVTRQPIFVIVGWGTTNVERVLKIPLDAELNSGARIINVSGGKNTVEIVKALRAIDKDFPIIATGGPTEETIKEVIEAGANAVTFTPPTSAEIFKDMMENYREQMKK